MAPILKTYVRWVDALNRLIGRIVMYVLLFALMGVLLYSVVAGPVFDRYPIWIIDMAEFIMAAYYLLGGGYSVQLGGHVRMDVLYIRFSDRTRAIMDSITDLLVIFYLVILLAGGISSSVYAIKFDQHNYTPWGPPMAPIKIIMVVGITLMLLQILSTLIKDVAAIRGETIDE